jgi:hypothetical protein
MTLSGWQRAEFEINRKGTTMKTINAAAITLSLLGGAPAVAESSVISPNGSRPNVVGAPQNFVGAVVVQPLSNANEHIRASSGHVSSRMSIGWST